MKNPITALEELQEDLTCSPLSAMQSLIDFAKHDLEGTIKGFYQTIAEYENRLALRDLEIAELEKHVDHETYFNRLADGFEQLELNAEHEGAERQHEFSVSR